MVTSTAIHTDRQDDKHERIESVPGQPVREVISYRLRCARTANGLSHYYMYGDLDPERTVL